MTPPATAALGARAARRPRPGLRPARRVSGPSRRAGTPSPPRRAFARAAPPVLQLLAAAERLSSHRLVDRLIRGRAWLVLVTCALIGVVTLQLALLKLNGNVGRTLQTQAQLQRENATLSIENSELAAADRVQTRAAQLGMEFASSTVLRSLAAHPRVDVSRAASVLSAPVRTQTPASEESSGRASSGSGEASSSQSSETSSSQPASAAEGKPAAEASAQSGSAPEAGSGSTSGSAQGGGEARSSSQGGASESESASGSAGGQGAPESGSSG